MVLEEAAEAVLVSEEVAEAVSVSEAAAVVEATALEAEEDSDSGVVVVSEVDLEEAVVSAPQAVLATEEVAAVVSALAEGISALEAQKAPTQV